MYINTWIQYLCYLILLVVLAMPTGSYIRRVMNGEKTFLSKVCVPLENFVYKIAGIDKTEEMNWKRHLKGIFFLSGTGWIFLFLLQLLQGVLPGNLEKLPGVKWDLALNTAVSFVTNTDWQAYSGESTMSYLTQTLGLTVQNFISAAMGITVLFALIRGLTRTKTDQLGNFWVDITRILIHILIPLNLVISLALVGGGVIQNFDGAKEAALIEPVVVDAEGNILTDIVVNSESRQMILDSKNFEGAIVDMEMGQVTLDGEILEDVRIVTKQYIPMGPAASQIAIKQTGTNGGGYFGTNSAHPMENPNAFTNLVELLSILLIPAALCFSFGQGVRDKKQGRAIFFAMFLCLMAAMCMIVINEQAATPQLAQSGAVDLSATGQSGGNMEGKETRFGITASSAWAAFTTAASNGSVNSMHDSYTPLGGMVTMLLMQLGEVVFGGVGCGLYGMLAFAVLTVFIAGLMVGRTPEFLGKKIEATEMKWSVVVCLAMPLAILLGSGIAALVPGISDSLNNSGPHGFSELLYAYSSAGGNNGSAFAGFAADTVFLNVSLAIVMLLARFLPIYGTLAIAGSMAGKKKLAATAGTLSTSNGMFVFLLILIVLLVGALSFFPALALGPIAEYLKSVS